MFHYVGLDVSLKTVSICIIDEEMKIAFETVVATDPQVIAEAIKQTNLPIKKAALESGGISHWLVTELIQLGLPVVCIDARKMSAAISMRVNKTDKNDAREIAFALRAGYTKELYLKPQNFISSGTLLTTRRLLVQQRTQIINCIKGLLKLHGKLFVGSSTSSETFRMSVLEALESLGQDTQDSIKGLLETYKTIIEQIVSFEDKIEVISGNNPDVFLLKTIPGVGAMTAITFVLEIGDPKRFKKSRAVGAFFGMAPSQYSSGDTKKQGAISKTGSNEMRALLSAAAMCMMYNTKTWSLLKVFGLKILKKHGHKKAVVALGRKLAVVMHRMLIDKKPFEPGTVGQKEIEKLVAQRLQEKKAKKKTISKVKNKLNKSSYSILEI
jgi:transposase